MDADPTARAACPDPVREVLEDRVYRPALVQDGRDLRGASPWATWPATLAILGACAGLTVLPRWRKPAAAAAAPSVDLVLQEPAASPGHAPRGGSPVPTPAPAPRAAPPAPAPAPPPEAPARPAPPPPSEEAPGSVPSALPTEDHSRDYGGKAGVPGGTGTGGPGAGNATGAGSGSGAAPSKVLDIEYTQIKEKFRPPEPPYPTLAFQSRIQGTVVIEITVGKDGIPIKAEVLSGPLALRITAIRYALTMKFFPYLVNGAPQETRFRLNMPFILTSPNHG